MTLVGWASADAPDANELTDILKLPAGELRANFLEQWQELEKDACAFTSLVDLSQHRHVLYVSPNEQNLLGYPPSFFLDDIDFAFFHVLCPPEEIPQISAIQAKYALETRQPNFDPRLPQIMNFHSRFRKPDNSEISIQYVSIVLEYSLHKDMILLANTYQDITGQSQEQIEERYKKAGLILIRLKKIYMGLFPNKFISFEDANHGLIDLYHPKAPNVEEITDREKMVLQLIAMGLSSKEIAHEMNISFHTAETYRKHLLSKFTSKNTAELIKKASKIYWLK